MNHLNELHPIGEGKMAFETAAGQVFLEASDEAMTPFGGFVPLAAFFEKLGLLDPMAAHCPAVRTSPNASAVRDVLASFILSCLSDGSRWFLFISARLVKSQRQRTWKMAISGHWRADLMQGYQRVLAWLNLTAPQLKNIQANAPPKTAESISI